MADSRKKLVGTVTIEVYTSIDDGHISNLNISSSFEDEDTVDILNGASIMFNDENLRKLSKV